MQPTAPFRRFCGDMTLGERSGTLVPSSCVQIISITDMPRGGGAPRPSHIKPISFWGRYCKEFLTKDRDGVFEGKDLHYVCILGCYTLCGGGHLEKHFRNKTDGEKLLRTTRKASENDVWPWQRRKLDDFRSSMCSLSTGHEPSVEARGRTLPGPPATDRVPS